MGRSIKLGAGSGNGGNTNLAGAGAFASLVRAGSGKRAVAAEGIGVSVRQDRLGIARGGRYSQDVRGFSRAAAMAAEGASLLQVAARGLDSILDDLDSMAALAQKADISVVSDADRARIDAEFQALRRNIDKTASETAFGETKLLAGGATAGSPLTIALKVGAGDAIEDTVTLEIGAASSSDLAANLASVSLAGAKGAAAARIEIDTAALRLGTIRARVVGDLARLGAVAANADQPRAGHQAARMTWTESSTLAELAMVVANQMVDGVGVHRFRPDGLIERQLLRGSATVVPAGSAPVQQVTADKPAPVAAARVYSSASGRDSPP